MKSMKYGCCILLLCLYLLSCQEKEVEKKPSSGIREKSGVTEKVVPESPKKSAFDFKRFEIGKGRIGAIKVGQNISDFESELTSLTKEVIESYDVGFDGGGEVYLYQYNKEPILAIVPFYDTDSIIALVGFHKELKTSSGIHPKMTANELSKKYPQALYYLDLMNGGELLEDTEKGWIFVFNTNEKNQIGVYKEIEDGSKVRNGNVQMDWITIR
ncbi:hypothetical protein [Sabulibacter ruber]|uniref:hypothetical protein n=1 Tax=Sabulibacter ruber TaxID=2811901 RepID=UPI001A966B7A|nr:hypothetical protein [Sabulibacter ruber]